MTDFCSCTIFWTLHDFAGIDSVAFKDVKVLYFKGMLG